MRGTSLTEMFNTPPAWSIFDPLVAALSDSPNIDALTVLERLTPVLESYEAVTRPRHFREKLGGKNSNEHADIYVFTTGLRPRGSMGHRIVRVLPEQQVEIMDIDRVLDDSEIFKPRAVQTHGDRLLKLTQLYSGRLENTLGKSLPTLRRILGNATQWIYDLGFLYSRDPSAFCELKTARIVMADAMMQAIDDLLPQGNQKLRKYLRQEIILCLESFDEGRAPQAKALLNQAADSLDGEAMRIIGRNASSRTIAHYKWLTHDKKPHKIPFRRAIAQACPVVMLLDDYADKVEDAGKNRGVDDALAHIFSSYLSRVSFYKGLSEERVGPDMARRLDMAARYIERGDAAHLPLSTRGDWDRVSSLINASRQIGEMLERPRDRVFNDCVEDVLANPDDAFLQRLQYDRHFGDLRIYKNRIVTHALVPKIIVEGQVAGIHIPVSHALYMAAESDCLDNSSVNAIPIRIRTQVQANNEGSRMINHFLRPVPVPRMIESAFFYATHRGEYDERLRNLIITNRLAEHGASYPWEALPIVRMEEDNYTAVPLNSQADLLKNSLETGDEFWRQAPNAIIDGLHFVALRRAGGVTYATAVLQEPKGEDDSWQVLDFAPAHGNTLRSNHYMEVFRGYVAMPEFIDSVDLPRIRATRKRLYNTLSQRAQDNERIGMSDLGDKQERVLKLRVLAAHWPDPKGFDIDEHGCISSPVIDARVKALVRAVAPFYRRTIPENRLQGPA